MRRCGTGCVGDSRPVAAIVAVFVQAGRGLAAAHAEGLLHRDFKPANVLVTESEDGRMRVKVTDFGIARVDSPAELPIASDDELPELAALPDLSHSGEADTGALTEAGTVMGTPRYMAPEQHCGGALGPAARSVCVLHRALGGAHRRSAVRRRRDRAAEASRPSRRGRAARAPRPASSRRSVADSRPIRRIAGPT